ncbi:MAG TPA: UvrD-helicase domain-containing protein [Bryobacteraceae bacterium]|nr:UvrD-helicase domain-containing protein [Bryobacteraceae bacterium]
MNLSPEQIQAARRTGQDVCVSAGPGSGKTRVLVERFRWLVEQGISPLRILAITFTEKAAAEIKARLVKAFAHRPDIRRQVERAYVSTIHAFCARLLRDHALQAGLDPQFVILDEPESTEALEESAEEALDELCLARPEEFRALLKSFAEPQNLAFSLIQTYRAARAAGVSLDKLDPAPAPDPDPKAGSACGEATEVSVTFAAERRLLFEALRKLHCRYEERKRRQGALDFADLIERSLSLLRNNPRVLDKVRAGFESVLMDEMQDTDPLQWSLLDLLRLPDRFFAVGDINQSIYGFRYAEPEVFRHYRDRIAAADKTVDQLRENHRSRREILEAVNRIFRSVEGVEPHGLEARRAFPSKDFPSVEVIVGHGENSATAAVTEARWVARRIAELVGSLEVQTPEGPRTARFRDVAVLVRSMNAMPPLEAAFREFAIPYLMAGGKAYFETRQARDLLHLLRVIANTCDEVSLATVLRSPLVGVGDETLLRLKAFGRLGVALWRLDHEDTSAFDAEDLARLRSFRDRLRRARQLRDEVPADQLLAQFLDASGYELAADGRARANTVKFLGLVREVCRQRPLRLRELVERLEIRRQMEREPEAPPDDASDVVRLMTIHQAKGLEFPIVFVAAMHKGPNRRRAALLLGPDGLGAKWKDPAGKENSVKDIAYVRALEDLKKREHGEEQRLLYVAMTRAEEHLVLSFALTKKPGTDWPKLVAEGLGITPELEDSTPVLYTPPGADFSVRLWRTRTQPAPGAGASSAAPPAVEQPVLLDPPALTGQHDAAVSVTSLVLYQNCPRRYYLARYLGWEKPPMRHPGPAEEEIPSGGDELVLPDAIQFGQQVHALLAGKVVDGSPEARALAAGFQSSELGRRAACAATAEREFDFVMEIEDLILRGQVDLWFEENERLVIVDYKTDQLPASEAPARAASYAIQLQLYAVALERLLGRRPHEAWVYFLRPGVAVPVPVSPAELDAARRTVRTFREAQERLEFPLRPGEQCFRCPFYRGLCPAKTPPAG